MVGSPKNWELYRIANMVLGIDLCGGCQRWPGTLACTYLRTAALKSVTTHQAEVQTLLALTDQLLESLDPLDADVQQAMDPNTIMMHLRTGDALTRDDCFQHRCTPAGDDWAVDQVQMQRTVNHLMALNNGGMQHTLRGGKPPKGATIENTPTVVLVYDAMHCTTMSHAMGKCEKKASRERSEDYVKDVIIFLENLGFRVKIRGRRNVDEDFAIVSKSRILVTSTTVDSVLVARLVKTRGGAVVVGIKVCEGRPAGCPK